MKLEILRYSHVGVNFLAIIKKGLIVDIACSKKDSGMFSEENCVLKEDFYDSTKILNSTEVQSRDLALYTHWPVHTKEFWDLLNET